MKSVAKVRKCVSCRRMILGLLSANLACGILVSCDDSQSTAPSDSIQDKIVGIWAQVKFEYYDVDSSGIDQGSETFTVNTTESILAFSTIRVNAYYVEPGNPTDGQTYVGSADYMITANKLFFGTYAVGPVEFRGDSLVIKEEIGASYERAFFIRYQGPVPPVSWPDDTYDVGTEFGI